MTVASMWPVRLDWRPAPAQRPQFGVVVFEDDPVSVPTLQQLLDPMGVDVQPARMGFPSADNDLVEFAERLRSAAATILPSAPPAAIGFACTTGAITLGPDRLRTAISRPGAAIEPVTPADAIIAALRHIDAQCVAIVSPYAEAASVEVVRHIERSGFSVSRLSYFDADNESIGAISSDSILAAARSACADGSADTLFLSCTGMRATSLIAALEAELGVTVLTSLQLMAWRAAALLAVVAQGPGQLFGRPSQRFSMPGLQRLP